MSTTNSAAPVPPLPGDPTGIDRQRVTQWLSEHIDGAVAPFEFELIAGGRSNLTFRVTDADGAQFVLRRPPLGHVLATAHDMAREHRVIAAVGRTGVPVPPALGPVHRRVGQRRTVLRDGLRRRRGARQHRARAAVAGRASPSGRRAPHRCARRPARGRCRRRRPGRLRQAHRLHRATGQAVVDAVGELQDARAARHRRGRGSAARAASPNSSGVVIAHGDFRFGNCLDRRAAGSHHGGARLGAVHPG